MDNEQRLARRRRRLAEVQHIVAEFLSSGMDQDEFCRSQEISRSTLYRYLNNQRSQEKPGLATQLVPVDHFSDSLVASYHVACTTCHPPHLHSHCDDQDIEGARKIASMISTTKAKKPKGICTAEITPT